MSLRPAGKPERLLTSVLNFPVSANTCQNLPRPAHRPRVALPRPAHRPRVALLRPVLHHGLEAGAGNFPVLPVAEKPKVVVLTSRWDNIVAWCKNHLAFCITFDIRAPFTATGVICWPKELWEATT